MISVTLQDGSTVLLNVDLIESVEAGPQTIVTLTSGRRLTVVDAPQSLIDAIHASRAAVLASVQEGPGWRASADVIQLHPDQDEQS